MKRWHLLLLLLFALYVATYLVLSRRGYEESRKYHMQGFYYFSPENSDRWRFKNYGCAIVFWPLNAFDRVTGFGQYPAHEPLWGLSK
jgi:hypothetical protein